MSKLIRINRRKPDQRLKKKNTRDRARRARLARRKLLRDERLARKELLRKERLVLEKLLLEWLREWPCEDLPASPRRAEKKIKRPSHHGTEEVTSEVGNNLKTEMK